MDSLPLVTCICPTRDRHVFLREAVRLFLAQDYPRKQLVIVEDGISKHDFIYHSITGCISEGRYRGQDGKYDGYVLSSGQIVSGTDARLHRLHSEIENVWLGNGKYTIGEKRNVACEIAGGDLVAHWDDDDWHSPRRLSVQVAALQAAEARVCGLDRLAYTDGARAWLYRASRRPWLAGGTLLYERALWRERPFDHVSDGEDTAFVDAAVARGAKVAVVEDPSIYVARIHPGNATRRDTSRWGGLEIDVGTVRGWMSRAEGSG